MGEKREEKTSRTFTRKKKKRKKGGYCDRDEIPFLLIFFLSLTQLCVCLGVF